jgi:hypothetical protein
MSPIFKIFLVTVIIFSGFMLYLWHDFINSGGYNMKKFLIVWVIGMAIIVTFFACSGCVSLSSLRFTAIIIPEQDTANHILAAEKICTDHGGIDHIFPIKVPDDTSLEGQKSCLDKNNYHLFEYGVICNDAYQPE